VISARWTRWTLEKYAEPHLHDCVFAQSSHEPEGSVPCHAANEEMYDDMAYLKKPLEGHRYPAGIFHSLRTHAGIRGRSAKSGAPEFRPICCSNVTIPHGAQKTPFTRPCPYAKEKHVLGSCSISTSSSTTGTNETLQTTTRDLIDVAQQSGGTLLFALTTLFYSKEQLHQCYPEIDGLFFRDKGKNTIPSGSLFRTSFYEKYGM